MGMRYEGEALIQKIAHMGPVDNNGYILTCPETGECVIIDAPAEPEKLLSQVKDLSKVRAVLITHGHGDHIASFKEMTERAGKPGGIHREDAHNLSPNKPGFNVEDGQVIKVGVISLRAIHTPGHTPGGVCYLTGKHLFSGDTLFPGGPGYTRSPEAFRQVVQSIKSKLFSLPDDTHVYPGHGDNTTIGGSKEEYRGFESRSHPSDLHGHVSWAKG